MQRKHKLTHSTSTYHVLGITCNRKPFWMALRINKTLKFDLRRLKDLAVCYENLSQWREFQFFSYKDETKNRIVCLVANHNTYSLLLNEYRNTDFFLVIDGSLPVSDMKLLVEQIRNIEGVVLAYPVQPVKSADTEYFFNAIEDFIDSNPE